MAQVDYDSRRHPKRRPDLRGEPLAAKPAAAPAPMMETEKPPPGYNLEERSFFDRIGDEVRSWFGDMEAERRREYDELMHHSYAESHRIGFAGSGGAAGVRGFGPITYPQSGNASSRSPSAGVEHDRPYDLEYQVWRERQMATLDKEYREYRLEKQQRFEENFNDWRQRRDAQRACLDRVAKEMEVVGSDGIHVGIVDCVRGDQIILARTDPDAHGVHHSIPCSWIGTVEDKLILEISAGTAQAKWRAEEG